MHCITAIYNKDFYNRKYVGLDLKNHRERSMWRDANLEQPDINAKN